MLQYSDGLVMLQRRPLAVGDGVKYESSSAGAAAKSAHFSPEIEMRGLKPEIEAQNPTFSYSPTHDLK